jgi:aryl-alcohol dehydrogenase-like predicted oxidoreductase
MLKLSLMVGSRQAAAAVSGDSSKPHSFSTIQLPGNLLEQEGLNHAAKWAAEHGLAVLINRPLNAFNDRGSYRLADYPDNMAAYEAARDQALAHSQGQGGEGSERMAAAIQQLDAELQSMNNVFVYENFLYRRALPVLRGAVEATNGDKEAIARAQVIYIIVVGAGLTLCITLNCYLVFSSPQAFLDECEGVVRHRNGEGARAGLLGEGITIPAGVSLQDYALSFLLDQPSVTTVLLGCRDRQYVREAVRLHGRYPPSHSIHLQ